MAALTIELVERDLHRLEAGASRAGKTVPAVIHELIEQLPEVEEGLVDEFDVTEDPVYRMGGFDGEGPADLATNHDNYLYGGDYPA